jgi:hypothetical protein
VDRVSRKARLVVASKAWGALAAISTNTPGSKAMGWPARVRVPLPETTCTVALRVEVCSEISVPAARQKRLYLICA